MAWWASTRCPRLRGTPRASGNPALPLPRGSYPLLVDRLFVDIDNTLVRWTGPGDQDWHRNDGVVRYMEQWQADNAGGVIVIWSHGGLEYAAKWAQQLVPGGLRYVVAPKRYHKGGGTDTFVDDDPDSNFAGEIVNPFALEGAH
ncbi:MAG: hypothetical protein KGL39_42420 [Patescibacteria group bacterium]|nr:hypothetical protein [Patescibacteria group bacterium]